MSLKKHIKMVKQNSVITPRLMGWLSNNDGIHTDDPEILEHVLSILAPTTGDRSGHFHPSQLYQCKRKQIYEFYGLVPTTSSFNPTLQNLFNDGHWRHLRWQVMLLSAGLLTDIEVSVGLDEYRLGGSMDGVNEDEGWVFELKGTSQYQQVKNSGVMPAHKKQIQAYLLASGYDRAFIVYEDKASQQWSEYEVSRDDVIIDQIETILSELNAAIDSGDMPEMLHDCQNQTGATYNNCPYNDSCHRISTTDEISTLVSIG